MSQQLIGAIEAGGTKFVLAVAREDGTVLAETRIPTLTPTDTFPAIARFFNAASVAHGQIAAFGVASFGPIDVDPASPAYGTFTTTPKPGWRGARFHDVLSQFGAPIAVDTDVNGAALGEWLAGAGADLNRATATLAYTTVGTGIGSGIVRSGQSLTGFSHFESGHIPVARDPVVDPYSGCCPYHRDCLEGLASGPAIEDRWGASLSKFAATADPDWSDKLALIAGYIAQLSVSLILLHMPDRLVFGGGVMKTPGLLPAVRRETARRLGGYISAPQLDPGLERYITLPSLGDAAGITGAILLGKRAI